MITKQAFKDILAKRILVLDGATGTMIQRFNLQEDDYRGTRFADHPFLLKGNNDLLCLTKPEVVREIHTKYLEAGADIIETNTFNANRISQADYNLQDLVVEMNTAAVSIARKVADEFTAKNPEKPRFVCASIGPTNKTASMSPDVNNPAFRAVTFDYLVEIYGEQVEAMLKAGADLLLVETSFDTLNVKACLYAIENIQTKLGTDAPVLVSFTIADASGRILAGQTIEACIRSITHSNILSIGLNCSLGAKELTPFVKELAEKSPVLVTAHPNAGLPNQFGKYDQTPEIMVEMVRPYLENSYLNIIGGCCGTTDDHIREIAKIVGNYEPRPIPKPTHTMYLSGLEPLTVEKDKNFINIGERTNVAGSAKFARLIREKNYEEALSIARTQVENGAQIIDVNLDDAMLDSKEEMIHFLNLLASEPEISRVPIMIDSSKWEVLEAGLKCVQGKCLINSLSLKEGEEIFLTKAAKVKRYGAALVVMAFDETGQADTYERKISVCKRAYDLLLSIGFPPEDIVFDTNVLTIATGIAEHDNYAKDFIESVRWIKQNLPYAKTSGGISNVSFSFRGNNTVREAMHSIFLYHAIKAGLDMGIVNPGLLQVYDEIEPELRDKIEKVVLNTSSTAAEELVEYASTIKQNETTTVKHDDWRNAPVERRLAYALLKGLPEHLEEDLEEARQKYPSSLTIIEGPLMGGMSEIGTLFGQGKMFLPQVVKSARTMKKAVSILEPYIEQEKQQSKAASAGKILLATVKGDVHDIGKNIVGVVLACNNFEVIDLGVMCPTEQIIDAAVENNVDFIGLSGLITPSLEEMQNVAAELERRHLQIPLLIGGATTSKVHTAVKIAPLYSAPVVYVSDASKDAGVCAALLSKNRQTYINELNREYELIRRLYLNRNVNDILPLSDARENKFVFELDKADIVKPTFIGNKTITDITVEEISNYIDWSFFFSAWGMNGIAYPAILTDEKRGAEATVLFEDAQKMLQKIISEKLLSPKAVIGFYPANSIGDDIEIYNNDHTQNIGTVYNYRQQTLQPNGNPNLCLSDFIAPKGTKIDFIGLFALTAGLEVDALAEKYKTNGDDYSSMLVRTLADRIAEAFCEKLHYTVRQSLWGYAPNETENVEQILKTNYRGRRMAIGYPSCPDHSQKQTIFNILNATKEIGVTMTESYMMRPVSSVCGLFFAHPEIQYFGVGEISKEQEKNYSERKSH
ncbi:MAG: methionine synthase [Bacteroidales bacterium]|nr:methionine synthase [Bacteroidales bacterium]